MSPLDRHYSLRLEITDLVQFHRGRWVCPNLTLLLEHCSNIGYSQHQGRLDPSRNELNSHDQYLDSTICLRHGSGEFFIQDKIKQRLE